MTQARVYQAADGRWLLAVNSIKSGYFTLEEDAQNMATKTAWATQAQKDATAIAQVADRLVNLRTVYFDRGYDSGGSNPIIDGDVTALGITAVQLGDLVTLAEHLEDFLNAGVVATLDRDPTLNAIRTDV